MLKTSRSGPVIVFRMGRNVGKWVLYYVHSFLLGDVLIDTSTVYVANELMQALNDYKINNIINTHGHEDHTGNNRLLQRTRGLSVYAHPEALPYLEKPDKHQPFYIKLCWNVPAPSTGLPLGDHFAAADNDLQVIHTPGHSPGHVCLYEAANQLLFTGDLFCGERVKYLRADEDFKTLLQSIKKLEDLKVETIYCAVSGVIQNGSQALQQKIRFMEELQDKTEDSYRRGAPPERIRQELLGREGLMYYASGGHFAKQNLINSILGLKN